MKLKAVFGMTSATLMVVPPFLASLSDAQVLGTALLAALFFVATFVKE